jgi:hypothetical protein
LLLLLSFIHHTPYSSAFEHELALASLQEVSRSQPRTKAASLTLFVLRLPASCTDQLLVSLDFQLADGYCGTMQLLIM